MWTLVTVCITSQEISTLDEMGRPGFQWMKLSQKKVSRTKRNLLGQRLTVKLRNNKDPLRVYSLIVSDVLLAPLLQLIFTALQPEVGGGGE